MSTETRISAIKRIFQAFKSLGNSDIIDYSDDEIIMVHPALVEALSKIENGKLIKEATSAVNVSGGSNKGKGLRKKYEAPTMSVEEMTPERLDEMKKILERDQGNDIIK